MGGAEPLWVLFTELPPNGDAAQIAMRCSLHGQASAGPAEGLGVGARMAV